MNFVNESLLTSYPLLFYVDLLIFFMLIGTCLFVLLECMFSEDLLMYTTPRLITLYIILFSLGYIGGRFIFL